MATSAGIYWPFTITNIGTTKIVSDSDLIAASINRILATRIGECVGEPEFGSKLHYLIFEPINVILEVMAKIYTLEALLQWETRISIIDVVCVSDKPNKTLTITIYYKEKETNNDNTTIFTLQLVA